MIIELCNKLNKAIHNPLFHNFYNIPNEKRYNQSFTSIDLIEDSQIAIQEFENCKSKGVDGRSTLLIYGLLQSFYIQQDGLFHLYKCVVDNNITQKDFFTLFPLDQSIREVRNDIAGHPTNRKESEYYFISKGPISKFKFTYGGYTPGFRKVDVDLGDFISNQFEFAKSILLSVYENINKKIEMKKNQHKELKLTEMLVNVNRNIELIYRGIRDTERSFQGEWGISGISDSIEKTKAELNLRYNERLPLAISEGIRMIDYIIKRLSQWQKENMLLGNDDAEIFLDSLGKQLKELHEMLKEEDREFNN